MDGALLIRNAHILTLDDAEHEWPCADIVVQSSRIVAIGPDVANGWNGPVSRTVDAAGLLAMPGLINAHFHSPGNLMKGCLDGMPLELFMLHEVPPLSDASATERLIYVRTQPLCTSLHKGCYAQLPVMNSLWRSDWGCPL